MAKVGKQFKTKAEATKAAEQLRAEYIGVLVHRKGDGWAVAYNAAQKRTTPRKGGKK